MPRLREVLSQRPGPGVLVVLGLGCVIVACGVAGAVVYGVDRGPVGVMLVGALIAGRSGVELRNLTSRWRPNETFFALAPTELAVAGRVFAELAAAGGDLPVTAWPAVDPQPGPGQERFLLAPEVYAWVDNTVPGGVPAGPRPDEQLIRRALGVVVLVSAASAHSRAVHAHLETAYGNGVPVVGVRVDDTDNRPPNLARTAITPYESAELAAAIRRWREQRQQLVSVGVLGRVRRALVADRDARG